MLKTNKIPSIYIKILIISLLFLILFNSPVLKTRASLPVFVVSGFLEYIEAVENIGAVKSVLNVDRLGIVETVSNVTKVGELTKVLELGNIQNIQMNTDLEISLETFLTNLANTFAVREENFLKTFELAKIEKAREDVNKLTFETQRELTGQGVIAQVKDPVTGEEYSIKKEGRIITNPDDFLFEEPIQKARDFTYCYLAPWKHFSLDSNDKQYCDDLGLEGAECATTKVCELMPFEKPNGIAQCPSDIIRDQIKQQLLSELVRKETSWAKAPPESWYTPAICEKITNSLSCANKGTCFKCDFLSQSCDIKAADELTNEELKGVEDSHSSLAINIALSENATLQEYQEAMGNTNNDAMSLKRMLKQQIQGIIDQYQTLRQTQYTAGQGIRPEKYLISFTDAKTGSSDIPCGNRYYSPTDKEFNEGTGDCKELDERFFGRALNMNYKNKAYTDRLFWFDTENIVSPAIVLLQKMAATAMAQFDLAMQGYRYPAINSREATTTISNASLDIATTTYQKPTITNLAPPWLDQNDYAKLPQKYIDDVEGDWPSEIDENFYLNRWYKDINQMYLPQGETSTFSRILKEWFCLENEDGLDKDCYDERAPKEYEP